MISGRAISTAPLSVRTYELGSGADSVEISITSSDGGFATIILSSETGTITISAVEGVTTVTTLNADSGSIDITSQDTGVTTTLNADTGSVTVSSSDNGLTSFFGSDSVTISLSTTEGKQFSLGSDSFSLSLSSSENGHQHVSGNDSTVIWIDTDDSVYVSFAGTNRTWTLNLTTGGHAQYTNYNFNSFFRIGNDYYGCSSTGIYKLAGSKDVTTNIAATATTGTVDFGVNTSIQDAYLLLRSEGDMSLITTTEESRQPDPYYIYFDERRGVQRRRVKLAKGISGNTWSITVANENGDDFMLKQIEVMPLKSKRRI